MLWKREEGLDEVLHTTRIEVHVEPPPAATARQGVATLKGMRLRAEPVRTGTLLCGGSLHGVGRSSRRRCGRPRCLGCLMQMHLLVGLSL
jgi:hypothetical protein